VVVEEEEAELGVAQARGQIVGGEAELALVFGELVLGAGNGAERALVGEGAVAEVDAVAADTGVVVGAEIGAARVEVGLLEGEQVEGVEGERLAHGERTGDHRHGLERLAQLGAGGAQAGDVDGVDGVDAVRDERALAPAQDLAAEAEVRGHAGGLELVAEVGVEQGDVGLDFAATERAERRALVLGLLDLEVLEIGGAEEGGEVAVLELEVVGALEDGGVETFAVVEVAVIAVDGGSGANGAVVG
jgi:hypothetical protein